MTTTARITTAIAAIVLAIIGTLTTASDAHAAIATVAGGTLPVTHDGPVVVQIKAPADSWQIKRSARYMDAQLPNVTIRTTGDCDAADVCVTVVVGRWTLYEMSQMAGRRLAWEGLTAYPSVRERTVYLNARLGTDPTRKETAAHEFAHALGLAHHDGRGITGVGPFNRTAPLSPAEVATIEASIAAQRPGNVA